jgi:hypothetical protein
MLEANIDLAWLSNVSEVYHEYDSKLLLHWLLGLVKVKEDALALYFVGV